MFFSYISLAHNYIIIKQIHQNRYCEIKKMLDTNKRIVVFSLYFFH